MDYDIKPVCAYSVIAPDNFDGNETFGMLYYADIYRLEDELHSEIEEISIMEGLPDSWTYPEIQPKLLEEVERRGIFKADYDAVVFDMDGVIFDSERAVLNCWILPDLLPANEEMKEISERILGSFLEIEEFFWGDYILTR